MATLYAKVAGGNWSAAGTWSNVNSAGVDDSGPPTAADDVVFEAAAGSVTVDTSSVGKTLSMVAGTGDYAATLTLSNTLTISGSITFSTAMTFTPGIQSVVANSTCTLTSAGKLFARFDPLSGTTTLGDNLSFTAIKTGVISITGAMNLGGFTISGNSATNRVRIISSSKGTGKTITVASGTFANCDFEDITFSNGGNNLDLSAISGLSGDCGGNTNTTGGKTVTFTTSATQTWSGSTGGNWSANAWSGRVPLPQDDVSLGVAFSASQTVTNDMPRLGRSIDFTGATGSPTFAQSTANSTHYGSLTLISAMTFTQTQAMAFNGRGAFTLTSAGKTFATSLNIAAVGGSVTLQDAYTETSGNLTILNGTFNANGFAVTINTLSASGSTTRAITMAGGTWTVTGSSGTPWSLATSTSMTLTTNNSTIVLSDTGASAKTFAGGSLTYATLQITGGGAGAWTFTGSNTFSNITIPGGTKTLTMTAGTTTTFTAQGSFGNGTNVITITAASTATFTKPAGGRVPGNYLALTNIAATETNTWYAGGNSTDNAGNTNWIFTNAPSAARISGVTARFFFN